ncbi:MAG: serine--tRNA ligase [Acidobacteria bacterium]|nr:serine--tRNA ligase [Acidobacteriota bacterium]MCI0722318.1 serine--tRNA ligase [Acidobacteriota bacterium]
MLDLTFIRQNLNLIRQKMQERGAAVALDEFEQLDTERRRLIVETESLKHRRNKTNDEITALKKQKEDASAKIAEMKDVSARIRTLDEQLKECDEKLRALQLTIPNIPHGSVPPGSDAAANAEIRVVGEMPRFNFEPKAHWELGPALGILDFDRAAKIAGARFSLYTGLGARLERALINFMLDVHTRDHQYVEVIPPLMVNSASMQGTGQLPKFGADLFKVENTDYWLIPTAEVPLTNIYAGEILEGSQLPVCMTAYTPCFRSEAGSYGKDTRGLIRQHQFNKVELVKFTRPDTSYDELEKLTKDAEEILKRLGLPYRTVALCTGDLGFSSAKTYDLEVWLPGQNAYREISSCSNFEDFQARRANIRFRPNPKAKVEFVHTLNGSGLAVGRTWVAVLENYQQADGSVAIPEALRPYMDGLERITH